MQLKGLYLLTEKQHVISIDNFNENDDFTFNGVNIGIGDIAEIQAIRQNVEDRLKSNALVIRQSKVD